MCGFHYELGRRSTDERVPVIGRWRAAFAVIFAATLVGGVVAVVASWRSTAPGPLRSWPLTIAVVGDSVSAGSGNQVVWPTLLAQRTGWSVANFALPDAGFVGDGPGGASFSHQIDRAEGVHPQVVLIVSGGVADANYTWTGALAEGVADALNKVKRNGQRALVIGPTWYEPNVPVAVRKVSDQIQSAAQKAGVPFLDALDPPWLTGELMQANLHGPSDEGQSVIADKVSAWLRTEVVAP